jgi:hypothetical protein
MYAICIGLLLLFALRKIAQFLGNRPSCRASATVQTPVHNSAAWTPWIRNTFNLRMGNADVTPLQPRYTTPSKEQLPLAPPSHLPASSSSIREQEFRRLVTQDVAYLDHAGVRCIMERRMLPVVAHGLPIPTCCRRCTVLGGPRAGGVPAAV